MGCKSSAPDNDGSENDGYIRANYTFGKTLGKGGSCRVVMVTDKKTEERFALKIMSKEAEVNEDLFAKEQKVLALLDHPNIIRFVDAHKDSGNYYIITELLQGGELFDRIVDSKYEITEKTASEYVRTMLLAIQHCHEKNIVHRDIKPENFVFKTTDPKSEMVLIDFGCAKVIENETVYKDLLGTPYYLAPESAAGNRYVRTGAILKSSDLWAIGVITYVLMTGRPPFNGHTNNDIFKNIIRKPLQFPSKVELSQPFKDFCLAILKKSPKRRMTLDAALKNPWVQGKETSDVAISNDVIKVLRQFNKQSKLKKAITKVLAHHMGEEPKKKIEEHFKRLDKDGNGHLDAGELTFLLMDMGYTEVKAKEEAKEMINSSDDNQSGFIEFDEFARIWQRKLLSSNQTYIHTIFSVLDTDGNGTIDSTELAQILDMTNEGDDIKIKQIIAEVDEDNDGKINFKEFHTAMTERNDFSGKGAGVGCQLKADEILSNQEDIDIDGIEESDVKVPEADATDADGNSV